MTVGRRRSMASGLVLLLLNETGRTAEDGLLLLLLLRLGRFLLLELGQLLATRSSAPKQRMHDEVVRVRIKAAVSKVIVHVHGLGCAFNEKGNGWRVVLLEKEGDRGRREADVEMRVLCRAAADAAWDLEEEVGPQPDNLEAPRFLKARNGIDVGGVQQPLQAHLVGPFGAYATGLASGFGRVCQGSRSLGTAGGLVRGPPTWYQPGSLSAAGRAHGPSELPLQVP